MHIGCHVPIIDASVIFETPKRAAGLGCEVMQIFTRSPQGGKSTPLPQETCDKFKEEVFANKIHSVYVHAPFYINLASSNNRIRYGSSKAIREELERASMLGAKYVITHLGSSKESGEKEGIEMCVHMLQKTLDGYNGKSQLLLENSAGAGSIIGDNLKELSDIIKKVGNEKIAGICLDTQHSFASGYDWNDFEKTSRIINKEIGLESIKLIHVNNSKSDMGSRKDRHAHIDEGKIEMDNIKKIVQFAQEKNIDLILETEHPRVKDDIEILKNLRDK